MQFISKSLLKPKSRLIFALCTGLLLTSTAPYIGLGLYAWIALVPLFLLIRSSTSYGAALLEALVFLLSYNLSFFIFIWGVHPLTWMHISNYESLVVSFSIWFSTALFHTLLLLPTIVLAKFLFQKNNKIELPILSITLISLAWVLTTHTLILNLGPNLSSIATPINQTVYSQAAYKELIQCCNLIGAIGLEFIIVLVNLLLVNAIGADLKLTEKKSTKYLTIIAAIFIAIFLYGKLEISNTHLARISKQNQFKSFAIVQANYSLASKEVQVTDPMDSIKLQYQLSNRISSKVDFLFWAEGSVRLLNKSQLQVSLFRDLANKASVFVYNAPMLILDKAYSSIDFMEYTFTKNMATGFNLKHYYKARLMPFGEYTPFYDFLPARLKKLSDKTIGKNYISSSPNKPILVNNVRIASSLCSELLFPQILRNQVRDGADLMLNLNDLSWFRGSMLKKLFLAIATFRAVENKRDLILSSNTGHSALINPSGEILVMSETNRSQVLQNSFLPSTEKALYTSYSW